jgi:hypothetical protein
MGRAIDTCSSFFLYRVRIIFYCPVLEGLASINRRRFHGTLSMVLSKWVTVSLHVWSLLPCPPTCVCEHLNILCQLWVAMKYVKLWVKMTGRQALATVAVSKWWRHDESLHVTFKALRGVTMNTAVFWDVTLCSLMGVEWRFRGTCCCRHQTAKSHTSHKTAVLQSYFISSAPPL